ncbi:hypothetical protein SNK04_014238 [Fusarium graminearum]
MESNFTATTPTTGATEPRQHQWEVAQRLRRLVLPIDRPGLLHHRAQLSGLGLDHRCGLGDGICHADGHRCCHRIDQQGIPLVFVHVCDVGQREDNGIAEQVASFRAEVDALIPFRVADRQGAQPVAEEQEAMGIAELRRLGVRESCTRLIAQFHGWLRNTALRTCGYRPAASLALSSCAAPPASSKLEIGWAPSESSALEQMVTAFAVSVIAAGLLEHRGARPRRVLHAIWESPYRSVAVDEVALERHVAGGGRTCGQGCGHVVPNARIRRQAQQAPQRPFQLVHGDEARFTQNVGAVRAAERSCAEAKKSASTTAPALRVGMS